MCLSLTCLWSCMLVTMIAPGLALRGPDGLRVSVGAGGAAPETPFVWGSVTKLITGVSSLRAASAGALAAASAGDAEAMRWCGCSCSCGESFSI